MFAGIDVGAERLHCVVLDGRRRAAALSTLAAAELDRLAGALAGVCAVAVDAPAETSTLPHRNDEALGTKFRAARCAEVALGREHGSWVPWVAPVERPASGWMATGFAVYEALAALGVPALEVFPYAGFRALADGARLPRKQTVEGRRGRVELLARRGVASDSAWSHDELDAALAALVAADHAEGRASRVGCGHDDSAIWLPAPSPS